MRAVATGDLGGGTPIGAHHAVHWGTVLVCLLGVTWLVHLLEATPAVLGYRYGMFQLLSRISPQNDAFRDVVVVGVDDDSYWEGELASRVPVNRAYLAKLLRRIAEAEPRLIALDFDLRSPDPEGRIRATQEDPDANPAKVIELPVHQQHMAETVELLLAADEIASRAAPVVLPATVKGTHETYRNVSDAHDGFAFTSPRITRGYLQLAADRRVIPPVLELEDGSTIDSLSLAIVRAVAPDVLREQQDETSLYASFLPRDRIPLVTTSELMPSEGEADAAAMEKLKGKVVLIGANWHSRAQGEGPYIDAHPSPVGLLQGVMLHANYVESLLQGKFLTPAGMWAATAFEWLLTGLVAFLLIAKVPWRVKWTWIVGVLLAYPLLSFFGMQLMGVYTDVTLLTLALVLHMVADVPTRLVHLTLKVKELEKRLTGRGVKGH